MANNQQVRVDLQFKGDMSDVEKKLQQLQNTLSGITSGKSLNNLTFGSELNKAIGDATKLQAILKNTTMANGNLDLTKFRSELQKSGLTVKELGNSLLSLGPQGSQAFSQLTQSIINAEVPLKRTSTLLSNFATTLKNTAKWQISSSILHGFMSSVSSAYNYAQDLNESLNNIRIVSKQNTDQMAEFAQEANKAAKELSVTTTAYTDAALIFYQQGLEGDAVTERTDVVAKMSNVTRDSVDEVSSYMTAIWNNFDDGSQSLEHYADVITGLGAATASSSAEIAAGLEKFAAVADTVGLSYDYATSALATVVAQTRQSADTVGTAFKTLFARIEGLKLGETLEDGVDLNKYSEALAKIGVSVLDANGQLRDMDSILDDMGAKWEQISKAQQVAIAQTVAGTRQYNQLVALMDNWDKVQDNLQIARSSDGELQSQADIYAESWEAAQKRVRAAWESIYSSLFDDKFFIKLTNGLGSFIEGLDKVIQSLGGLKGILPILTAGLVNLFNKDIANGVNNFVYNLQIGTKKAQEELIDFKSQFSDIFKDFTLTDSFSSGALTDSMSNQATLQQAILEKQKQLNAEGKDFSETEKLINQTLIERVSLTNQEMVNVAKETEALQSQLEVAKKKADAVFSKTAPVENKIAPVQQYSGTEEGLHKMSSAFGFPGLDEIENNLDSLKDKAEQTANSIKKIVDSDQVDKVQVLQSSYGSLTEQFRIFIDTIVDQGPEAAKESLIKIQKAAIDLGQVVGEDTEAFKIFESVLESLSGDSSLEQQKEAVLNVSGAVEELGGKSLDVFESIIAELEDSERATEDDIKVLKEYFELLKRAGEQGIQSSNAKFNADMTTKMGVNMVQQGFTDNQKIQKPDVGANFANATKAVMNFGTALNSVNTLLDKLMDKEASFGDKMLAVLTNGSMAVMMMGNSFKGVQGLIEPIIKNVTLLTAQSKATAIANKASNVEISKSLALEQAKLARAKESLVTGNLVLQTEKHKERQAKIQLAIENSKKTIKESELTISKLTAIEKKKELQGEIMLSAYEEGRVGFLAALLAISKLQTAEDKKQLAIELVREGLKKVVGKVVTGIKTALSGIQTLITGIAGALGISAAALGIILAVVAAIGVAIAVAYKNYKNNLEAAAEADKKLLSLATEKREAAEKECKAIEDLTDAYKALKDAQEDLSPEEMKSKVFDLCMQYGQEALAVRALAGEYDNLEDALSEAQAKKSGELVSAAEHEKNVAKQSAISSTIVKADHRADDWGKTIDLKGLGATFSNTANGRFKADLEELGLDVASGSGKVNTEQLIDVIMKDPKKFKETIDSSSTKAAQQLKEIYDELQPQLEALDGANEALRENLGRSYDTSGIKSLETYQESMAELAQKALNENLFTGEDAEERARNWARQALSGVSDEINQFAQEDVLIDALVGKDASKEIKDRVAKTLDSLPKEVSTATIAANAELVQLLGNGNIEQGIKLFAERFGDLLEYNTEQSLSKGLISAANSKEGPTPDQISQLYDQGFNPGMSEEDFGKLDLTSQRMALLEFYLNMQDMTDETKEAIVKSIQDEIQEVEGQYEEYTKNREELEERYNKTVDILTKEMVKKYGDQWDEAYIRKLEAQDAELTEEEKKDKKRLEEESKHHFGDNRISSLSKAMDKSDEEAKKYSAALAQLRQQLNNVEEGIFDTASAYEALETIMKGINEATDNFQQAFQNLSDAVAEFNENGYVTMDTLQTLWTMDNSYLASLEILDGQLKLNTGTLEAVANAQIDAMEAEALNQLQVDLLAMAEEDEANTDKAVAQGAANKIGSLNNVIAKVKEGTAAWREYATEQALAMTGQASLNDNQKDAINAFYNKIALAEGLRKQIGTKNFGTAMNVKSGKSGGGSKKDKEEKELKEWADEFDRFYPYKKVIEDLTDAISDLAKEQEHMAGGELVGALHKQNRLLQEQKKAYQELAKEQKKYQKEMQLDLAKYGMSFDTASGNIVNYAQSTQAMLDQYNAAIEKYNKSAQSDADKKTLEAVEKEYEKFKKLVSNYQGILTEIQDTENNLDDIYYETIANNLKEFEIMVQVNLDIKETERTVNDFINKINKNFKTLRKSTEEWMSVFDNALKNAHTYVDGEYSTISVDLDALNKVKSAIDSGDYGNEGAMFASETEAIMKYKELSEQLKDDAEELYELYTDAWSEYLDAIDEAIESWEELLDEFDDINDTLDHYEKLVELVSGNGEEQKYNDLLAVYEQQAALHIKRIETVNTEINTLKETRAKLLAAGAKETDEDVKKLDESIKNGMNQILESLETATELARKSRDLKFDHENKEAMKQALGFDMDELSEQWNRAKKAEEGYYDENQRIYQLDKLRRKYNDVIDDTKDIKLKKKLAEMRDTELKALEKKKRLSEGDLEIAEKALEVEKAEIALKEAQDNKSTMRLQRDSQGNWSYQFVANEDDISDKQQRLMDASNDLYETVKKNEKDLIENSITWWTEWNEARSVINEKDYATREEYLKALDEVDKFYSQQILDRVDTLNGYKDRQAQATAILLENSYQVDTNNYEVMTQNQKDLVDEMQRHHITDIAELVTADKEAYEEIRKKTEEVNKEAIEWWNQLEKVCEIDVDNMRKANENFYNFFDNLLQEYERQINTLSEVAQFDLNNIGEAARTLGDEIQNVTDKVQECIDRSDDLSRFRDKLNEIEQAWYSVKDSITNALSELNGYLERLRDVKEMQDVVKSNATDAATGDIGRGVDAGGDAESGETGGGNTETNSDRNYGGITKQVRSVDDYYHSSDNTYDIKVTSTSGESKLVASHVGEIAAARIKNSYRMGQLLGWDTGGYTGSWSDGMFNFNNGKLAILHQKELILNQADTKNILDAVQLVRDMNSSNNEFASYLADIISQSVDALAQVMESGINILGERMAYTSDRVASALLDAGSRQLEQNVHIDASFPNVSDRHEIEDAFNNLVNIASQRVLASDVLISDSYLI